MEMYRLQSVSDVVSLGRLRGFGHLECKSGRLDVCLHKFGGSGSG